MNKEEALRCLDISKSKFANGNSEAAIKFATKSISLHSTANAVEWLEFISKTTIKQTKTTPRQRKRSPSPNKKEESRPFTQEQVDGINKIKRFKAKGDLYSILGVTKGADDVEIKKAYRKVALLYHPDKCTAPGADDAFKAIGHAFAVLGDKEKRSTYDMFGSESGASGMGRRASNPFGAAQGFHPNSNFSHFEAEVSPEELFNMFFGPNTRGPRPAFRTDGPQFARNSSTRSTNNRPRRNPEYRHVDRSTSYLQLLPVFFLLLFTLISWLSGGLGVSEFGFSKSSGHSLEAFTKDHNVKFFVDPWKYNHYRYNQQKLRQLERRVERQYYQNLQYSCAKEREERNYKMAAARGWFDVNMKEYTAARDTKLPACEALRNW